LNPNTSVLDGIGSAPPNPMGWYIDLGPTDGSIAERINITPVANVGIIGIGINRPVGGACEPGGSSRVLGLTFGTGKSVLIDSTGALVAQSTATTGLITDIGLLNVGGKIRMVAGDTSSNVRDIGLGTSAALSLKRLNWREVPTVD
jgi:type IV pilus assembly protein PilY1